MDLGQLLYMSDAAPMLSRGQVELIHEVAARNNARRGITGILFYTEGHFVQLLEGERPAIRALFEVIKRDERHASVRLLYERPVPGRLFTEWSMAMLDLDDYSQRERLDLDDLVHLCGYQVTMDEEPIEVGILKRFRALLSRP